MKGWCPRHDRVYEAEDARCPECGTYLVETKPIVVRERREVVLEEYEPPTHVAGSSATVEAPRPARTILLLAVSVAIMLVFAAGFATGRRRSGGPVASPSPTAKLVDLIAEPRLTSEANGVTISLVRVNQSGKRVVASFQIVDGIEPELITEISGVASATESNPAFANSPPEPAVVSGTGFELTFELDVGTSPVRVLRIEGIAARVSAADFRWIVDVSRIWPASASSAPRVLRVGKSVNLSGRSITLSTMLAWEDRLEAVFDYEPSEDEGLGFNEVTVTHLVEGGAPQSIETSGLGGFGPGTVVATMPVTSLAEKVGRLEIVLVPTRFIQGSWFWLGPFVGPGASPQGSR